ncbi:MAG: hypothetical protein ACPG4Z_02330 [Chitinophagales bacterium]
MKRNFFPALLAALGFVSLTTSCGDDDGTISGETCYRCSNTYSYGGQTYSYSYTICEEDFNANYSGSGYTFESYIDELKSEGYTCEKKYLN